MCKEQLNYKLKSKLQTILEMAEVSLVVGLLVTVVTVSLGQDCRVKSLARYNVTFEGMWDRTVFPKQYPLWRPPAQWSGVLGKS